MKIKKIQISKQWLQSNVAPCSMNGPYSQTWLNFLYFYYQGSSLCWFELCIRVAIVLTFMFKLPSKFQPLKNFKYKYLFGDGIPKRDGASSSQIHDDVVLHVSLVEEFVEELHCEVMDPILAQENIALTKIKKKAYEINKHFQRTWVVKLPWAEFVLMARLFRFNARYVFSLMVNTSFQVSSLIHFGSMQDVVKLWQLCQG